MLRQLICVFVLTVCTTISVSSYSQSDNKNEDRQKSAIDELQKPLYSPFIERYVLDELKQLRIDFANQKHELMQQILDREHSAVDRGVTYATSTISYFFYLIAGATSLLVIIGWTSIRDIK